VGVAIPPRPLHSLTPRLFFSLTSTDSGRSINDVKHARVVTGVKKRHGDDEYTVPFVEDIEVPTDE
jgi:hypothetical protein